MENWLKKENLTFVDKIEKKMLLSLDLKGILNSSISFTLPNLFHSSTSAYLLQGFII